MTEAYIASTHINYHHQVYRFHNRADLSDDNPRVTITDLEPLADLSADPNKLLDWYNLPVLKTACLWLWSRLPLTFSDKEN